MFLFNILRFVSGRTSCSYNGFLLPEYNNKHECTTDQELANARAEQMLHVGRQLKSVTQIKNLTPSIDAHLLEEQSCQVNTHADHGYSSQWCVAISYVISSTIGY